MQVSNVLYHTIYLVIFKCIAVCLWNKTKLASTTKYPFLTGEAGNLEFPAIALLLWIHSCTIPSVYIISLPYPLRFCPWPKTNERKTHLVIQIDINSHDFKRKANVNSHLRTAQYRHVRFYRRRKYLHQMLGRTYLVTKIFINGNRILLYVRNG